MKTRHIFLNYYRKLSQSRDGDLVTLDDVLDFIKQPTGRIVVQMLNKYEKLENIPEYSVEGNELIIINENDEVEQVDTSVEKYQLQGDEYSRRKETEVGYTCFNSFSRKGRRKGDMSSPTNFVFLDIDGIGNPHKASDLASTAREVVKKALLQKFDFIYSIWISLSGFGLGFIVKCDAINSKRHYEAVYDKLASQFDDFLMSYGLNTDPNAKGFTQPTLLPYDPSIIVRVDAALYPAKDILVNVNELKGKQESIDAEADLDYSMPLKEQVSKAIISQKVTYYSIFRRYTEYPNDSIVLARLIEERYDINEIDYNSYTILNDEKSDVYDAKESLPVTKRMYFEGKVKEGVRNSMIGLYGMKLIFNNPFRSPQKLLNHLQYVNANHFQPPLSKKEVYNSFIYNYRKYMNGDLDFSGIIDKHVYHLFPRRVEDCGNDIDARKAKQKLASQVHHNNKKREKIESIKNAMILLEDTGKKVTQTNLEEITGITRKTVSKYLKIIKEENG